MARRRPSEVAPHPRQQAGPRWEEGRERQHQVPITVVRGDRLSSVFPGLMGKKIQLDNGTELDLSNSLRGPQAMIKDIGNEVDVGNDAQVHLRGDGRRHGRHLVGGAFLHADLRCRESAAFYAGVFSGRSAAQRVAQASPMRPAT
jgi:hypothetical protein